MHPVPVGETGEARSKGQGRGGGSPGLHDHREEGRGHPAQGQRLHPCAALGAAPLSDQREKERRGRVPAPDATTPAKSGRLINRPEGWAAPGVMPGSSQRGGSASLRQQSGPAERSRGPKGPRERRPRHHAPQWVGSGRLWGATNGGPRARDRHREAETPAQQGRGLGPPQRIYRIRVKSKTTASTKSCCPTRWKRSR